MPDIVVFVGLWVIASAGCATPGVADLVSAHPSLSDAMYGQTIDLRQIDYVRMHAACLLATNEARQRHGQQRLPFEPRLEEASRNYAVTMAREHFLAHEHPSDPTLKDPEARAKNVGIPNPFIAENIALIQSYPVPDATPVFVREGGFSLTPEGPIIVPHTYRSAAEYAVEGWLNSPGHRRNLLSGDARQLGCGAALTSQGEMPMFIWVQNFQLYENISP